MTDPARVRSRRTNPDLSPDLSRDATRRAARATRSVAAAALRVAAASLLSVTTLHAATVRKADDTIVTGRVVAIRGDKLIVVLASTQPAGTAAGGATPSTAAPTTGGTSTSGTTTGDTPSGSARTMSQRLFPTRRPASGPTTTGPTLQAAPAAPIAVTAQPPAVKPPVTRPATMQAASPAVASPASPASTSSAGPAASQPAEIEIPLDDVAEVAPLFEPGAAAVAAPAIPAVAHPTTAPDARPWKLKTVDGQTITLQNGQWSDGNLCGSVLGGKLALTVPSTFVAEWWCGANDQLKAAAALNEPAGLDDVAYAARDKSVLAVRGLAVGMDAGSLKFKYGGQERAIALARLVGIVFARSPEAVNRTKPSQIVTVAGNEQVSGTWTGLDDKFVTFTTAWGQLLQIARTDVNKITFRNGRVASLSDLVPIDVKQTPYFDRVLPWQADKTLDGKPLQLDGPVPRGIAMHSETALTYQLGGEFAEFKTRVGFDQPAGRLGDVVLRVRGDGRTLLEKPSFKGTDKPIDLSLSVSGVQKLTIEVDFGDGQDVGDRVIWAAARVIRPAK